MKDPKIRSLRVHEGPDGLLGSIEFTTNSDYGGGLEFSSMAFMDAFIANLQQWRSRLAAAFPICEVPAFYPQPAEPEPPAFEDAMKVAAEAAATGAVSVPAIPVDDNMPF